MHARDEGQVAGVRRRPTARARLYTVVVEMLHRSGAGWTMKIR